MSQLDAVLRRSIAHLDPTDRTGRDRVFASARDAMRRLLLSYDPPLTDAEIASKTSEFEAVVDRINDELSGVAAPRRLPAREQLALAAIGSPTPARVEPRAAIAPPIPAWVEPEPEFQDEDRADDEELLAGTEAGYSDERDEDEPADDEWSDDAAEYEYDEYDDYDDYDDEAARRGLGDWIAQRRSAIIGAVALVVILIAAGVGALFYWPVRSGGRAQDAIAQNAPAPIEAPAASAPAAPVTPRPAAPPPSPEPTPSVAKAPAVAGALALESIVLFDGRDPSVFQSAPENPVHFEGDTAGGFAQVSSSTGATGARLLVGRGVYERIAGHRIRIVLVVRASRNAPATSMRFSYQNGRNISPWTDIPVGADYAPLSAEWAVPKERGGPESDALIIEPGVPGDQTAVDIRSARIEVLD